MPKTQHLLPKLLLLTLFATLSLQHQCNHDKLDSDLKVADPSYSVYDKLNGRFLAEYENIQILVDASTLTGVSDKFKDYIVNSVMPAVINYFEAAIKVPSRTKKLKAGGYSSLCSGDIKVPSAYNSVGVDADLILFIRAVNDDSASYVAAASACLLDTSTQRPIVGRMTYNLAKVSPSASDADREQDIVTTMHELTHVLGFSGSLFPYYVNPDTGKSLKNHVTTKSINGLSTTILNIEPLTTRLRNYFNCSTLAGAYIENQGGSGSAGSHFERRVFYNEYMTASSLIDSRVSEFSLALLEGTGWYKINYDMAEPMTWGKNKGCDFVEGSCVNTATKKPTFEEFCPSLLTKGCSWTYRAGSSCGAFQMQVASNLPSAMNWWKNNTVAGDSFADNCPIQLPYNNLDCEDSDNQDGATISGESYGYGSKCFLGTLYPKGKLAKPYPYCFKSSCKVDSQGQNYVELKIGTRTVTCTSEKDISVTGYNGVLNCPDPDKFCGQVLSEGYCRRKCSGRGTCVKKECECIEGWSGFDCSKPTYLNQCSRCANNGDPLRTSCYGDSCECNPSNTTCMCLLGLQTGSSCNAILAAQQATVSTIDAPDSSDPMSTTTQSTTTDTTTTATPSSSTTNTTTSNTTSSNYTPISKTNITNKVTNPGVSNSTTSTSNNTTTNTATTDPDSGSSTPSENSNTSNTDATPDSTKSNTDPNSKTSDSSSASGTNTASESDPEDSTEGAVQSLSNQTISERTSVYPSNSDQTTAGQLQTTTASNNVILPAVLGAIGGALTVIAILFGVKYFNKKIDDKKRLKGRTISRPPKLTIPVRPLEEVTNQSHHSNPSHQNSPADVSRGRLSFRSHHDSPLISHGSPMKERIYTHSLFKNYSPETRMNERNSAEAKEVSDFGLKLEPVMKEGNVEDVENPQEMEKSNVDVAERLSPKFGLVVTEEVEIIALDAQIKSVQKSDQ